MRSFSHTSFLFYSPNQKGQHMNICIYGASGSDLRNEYFKDAEKLGALMARDGHKLVFGGGNSGLMGACARGAYNAGGEITGIAPRFFDEPGILFEHCTDLIFTETMRERKQLMEERSDAFIVLPGGIGTFEEFFEMLTLKQLGRHDKPMAVLSTLDYYAPMLKMLECAVDGGFMGGGCMELFCVCSSPEEALFHLLHTERKCGSIRKLSDYGR